MYTQTEDPAPPRRSGPKRTTKMMVVGAAMVGAAIGGAAIAGAATSSPSSTTNTSAPASSSSGSAPANAPDPATMTHGPGETLLTGTTADQVKAAALAAVPNATVIRVETDSAGSPYEAHLKKSDGTYVTVKVDSSFKVTSTEQGFGSGPDGQAPPNGGQPPANGEQPQGTAG